VKQRDLIKRRTESLDTGRQRDKQRCINPYWLTERGKQQLKEWAEKCERWNPNQQEA